MPDHIDDLIRRVHERWDGKTIYEGMPDWERRDAILANEVVRLREVIEKLGGGASASLSDGQFEGDAPHPDHLRLADWVMTTAMLALEGEPADGK